MRTQDLDAKVNFAPGNIQLRDKSPENRKILKIILLRFNRRFSHEFHADLGSKTPIHAPKIGVLGANVGRGGAMLTPTNSFLLLGVVTSLPFLAKIDHEM